MRREGSYGGNFERVAWMTSDGKGGKFGKELFVDTQFSSSFLQALENL